MTARDPRHASFIGDEFAGIDTFPFASTEISLAAVNHRRPPPPGAILVAAAMRLHRG